MRPAIQSAKWLIFLVSLFTLTLAVAQSPPDRSSSEPNGCGTGWNRYVIPDKIKFIGCDFKKSCDEHDVCYGACTAYDPKTSLPQCEYLRCQPGGDIYGKKDCDGIKFRRLGIVANERRVECDGKFMVNIVKNNPGNSRCTLFSAIYPSAVRILGSSAFVGIDTRQGWTEDQKNAYATAINRMFSEWNDVRVAKYAAELKAGRLTVDFNKQIKFDEELGIVNVE
jgi:hypothetical protein